VHALLAIVWFHRLECIPCRIKVGLVLASTRPWPWPWPWVSVPAVVAVS
jgi:hypothetical protein